ncbi:MAG: class I SAM-dependent methyltransferase, partial [Eubacteriales bacterium]|nr:class I SAM-dependent methyltransferase [Eubacteriales bacterium]
MEGIGMTARVSAFARSQHARSRDCVYCDPLAEKLLTQQEMQEIASSMTQGIGFFCPGFQGTPEEGLRWIVEHQLAPSPLGRAAFAESALEQSGAQQYLILAAGLDSFGLRQPGWARGMEIFEVDLPGPSADKQRRIEAARLIAPENLHFLAADLADPTAMDALRTHSVFDGEKRSFCSLLGIVYYLKQQDFSALLRHIVKVLPAGSRVAMDYPARDASAQFERQSALARGAGEAMHAAYTRQEMEKLLQGAGFRVEKDLNPAEITETYFAPYNERNPDHPIYAAENVNYCLAERI